MYAFIVSAVTLKGYIMQEWSDIETEERTNYAHFTFHLLFQPCCSHQHESKHAKINTCGFNSIEIQFAVKNRVMFRTGMKEYCSKQNRGGGAYKQTTEEKALFHRIFVFMQSWNYFTDQKLAAKANTEQIISQEHKRKDNSQ